MCDGLMSGVEKPGLGDMYLMGTGQLPSERNHMQKDIAVIGGLGGVSTEVFSESGAKGHVY